MKKSIYSVLAFASAITGVMISKANASSHRAIVIYKYIGGSPVDATLVTNLNNWTAVSSIPTACHSSQAACAFTTTIPTVTMGTRHIPSAPINAAVGGTAGVSYYIPILKASSGYTYLHSHNQTPF